MASTAGGNASLASIAASNASRACGASVNSESKVFYKTGYKKDDDIVDCCVRRAGPHGGTFKKIYGFLNKHLQYKFSSLCCLELKDISSS